MEQKDYLMRQIDMLGEVLAAIFGKLLNLKNQNHKENYFELINNELKEEANIDLNFTLNPQVFS